MATALVRCKKRIVTQLNRGEVERYFDDKIHFVFEERIRHFHVRKVIQGSFNLKVLLLLYQVSDKSNSTDLSGQMCENLSCSLELIQQQSAAHWQGV